MQVNILSKVFLVMVAVLIVAAAILKERIVLMESRPDTSDLQRPVIDASHETPVSAIAHAPIDDRSPAGADDGHQDLMSIGIDTAEFKDAVRVEYRNSPDLPDGISFSLTLTSISASFDDDPDSSTYILMEKLSLDFDAAEKMASQLGAISIEYEKEIQDSHAEMLCLDSIPRVYGDDVYAAFETAEMIQDAIAEEKYLAFLSTLSAPDAERFRAWNDELKLSTTTIRFRYKSLFESKQIDPDVAAAEFCLHQA